MLHIFRVIFAGLVLAVIALVSALITMRLAIHGAEVRVPDLSGLTIAQALEQTHSLGLQLNIADRFYSTTTPSGHVLNQRPQPGTLVRRSWRVRVTESLGAQDVTIPNVLGMDARQATITIRREGLQLGDVTSLPYANASLGTVIAQSPTAHANSIERPRVDILLAATPPETTITYAMPNLIGESFSTIAPTILSAGFQLASVEERNFIPSIATIGASSTPPSPPVPSGTVLSQLPEAGSPLTAGATIRLSVQH